MNSELAVDALTRVMDPEVPVLSVLELGVVRHVEVTGTSVTVTITPTYSGCPALHVMEEDIRSALEQSGFSPVTIHTVYAPAWTTDWMSAEAREKLRVYGIAPPGPSVSGEPVAMGSTVRRVACPSCGSLETTLESEFGATSCKSLHYCRSCREPFEHFKPF